MFQRVASQTRDIACRNLLVDGDVVKVGDFGLSRVLDTQADRLAQMGQTTNPLGPLQWEAPEAILRCEYSRESDVFMFGCCIYEMVCE